MNYLSSAIIICCWCSDYPFRNLNFVTLGSKDKEADFSLLWMNLYLYILYVTYKIQIDIKKQLSARSEQNNLSRI